MRSLATRRRLRVLQMVDEAQLEWLSLEGARERRRRRVVPDRRALLFADGTLGSRTAMLAPYTDVAGSTSCPA